MYVRENILLQLFLLDSFYECLTYGNIIVSVVSKLVEVLHYSNLFSFRPRFLLAGRAEIWDAGEIESDHRDIAAAASGCNAQFDHVEDNEDYIIYPNYRHRDQMWFFFWFFFLKKKIKNSRSRRISTGRRSTYT